MVLDGCFGVMRGLAVARMEVVEVEFGSHGGYLLGVIVSEANWLGGGMWFKRCCEGHVNPL